jgi:hypothetical protein
MSTFLFSETIFGPIHSRRLGSSLGINLLPVDRKYCNFNCVYCECGANIKGGDEYQKQVKRTAVYAMDSIHHISDGAHAKIMDEIDSGTETDNPLTYSETADHLTDASGDRPDSVKPVADYKKSKKRVSKTQKM